MKQILICGNYGAENLGDELILKGLLKMLKDIPDIDVTVMSAHPENTEELHKVKAVKILPTGFRSILKGITKLPETLKAIKKADLILFGGGGLFNEEEPYSLYLWSAHAQVFRWFQKKYIILGQSFSPLTNNLSKKIVQKVINNAQEVFVRDQESQDLLYLLDINKKVEVTTDLAFILDKNDFEATPEKHKRIYCLRNYKNIEIQELSKKLEQLKCEKFPFEGKINIHKYWSNFLVADVVVGMRLHSIILAMITATPFIALSYNTKVENMARKLGFLKQVLFFPIQFSDLERLFQETLNKAEEFRKQLRIAVTQERELAEKQKIILTKIIKKV